jgi:DNA-binding XRE family transcriptional regulator
MIGQFVLSCQDTVSQDRWTKRNYPPRVVINNEEALFNDALCARVHRLRNERGWTAAQMATALGIPPERYRKYEYRSPLPHYLMERFALIVGRDLEYVLLGRAAPVRIEQAESRRKQA